MVLVAEGRSSGFCIDPVEKKPLNHFLPGTPILSFGTTGCNLTCAYCQNWDISHTHDATRLGPPIAPEDIAEAALRTGCHAVAATYNEPIITLEYVLDVAAACHDRGLRTVAVTAGYITENAAAAFFPAFDAVNVDLKGFTETFYRSTCGGALAPVKAALAYIVHETQTWLEITTLLIPGLNDSDADIIALSHWIATALSPNVPLHFTAFHPTHKMTHLPPTPSATLVRARHLALAQGLRFVYTGNVHDTEGGTTFCPVCNTAVIRRDWYEIKAYALDNTGLCAHCGTQIPGIFDGPKGTWGRKRWPIDVLLHHGSS